MDVLRRGFPWGTAEFLNGAEENLAVLKGFEDELAAKAQTGPPFWWGLDDAMEQDPELLRMALDIMVAYLKNYQLDRCEAVARYVLPVARARGLPWNVKALQDCATLRMKQARQAEAMLLLEEINGYVPPNPIHCKNLGVTYNQLQQHERALACFEQAVRLQNGVMNPSDHWDIGIAHKHMRNFDEALPSLLNALEGFELENADAVTMAKIHDNVGSCYLEMGKAFKRVAQYAEWAEPYIRKALSLYDTAIGTDSPLYGGTVRLLAKAMRLQGRHEEAEPWMKEALRIETDKDAIHPTPIHEVLEDLLEMAAANHISNPVAYHDILYRAVHNLERRGHCTDGNGGMVMQKVARFLALSGGNYRPAALQYFKHALELIRGHQEPQIDTSMHCMILEMEIYICEQMLQSQPLAILDIERSVEPTAESVAAE
uniref:Uncharacterized protein n=1 Tax=Pyrodinium bahamense TaxID=73915 RepID=A0A7S0FFR9_9DINO